MALVCLQTERRRQGDGREKEWRKELHFSVIFSKNVGKDSRMKDSANPRCCRRAVADQARQSEAFRDVVRLDQIFRLKRNLSRLFIFSSRS